MGGNIQSYAEPALLNNYRLTVLELAGELALGRLAGDDGLPF
jgi:hypothetical protein